MELANTLTKNASKLSIKRVYHPNLIHTRVMEFNVKEKCGAVDSEGAWCAAVVKERNPLEFGLYMLHYYSDCCFNDKFNLM